MFKIIKIVGNSMADKYLDGDFVLIMKSPFFKYFIKEGRDVVFNRAPYGVMIKEIIKINDDNTIDLSGINEESISRVFLKNVDYSEIIGIVIKRFK